MTNDHSVRSPSTDGASLPRCKPLPPAQTIRDCLTYHPETGRFVWRIKVGSIAVGDEAGAGCATYRKIKVGGVVYLAHRLAWTYMTGNAPPDIIDHINGDRLDNRWVNLRAATNSQNLMNSRTYRGHAIGLKGVYQSRGRKNFGARISIEGKSRYLGSFDTAESAHEAYKHAAQQFFGEYARGGK